MKLSLLVGSPPVALASFTISIHASTRFVDDITLFGKQTSSGEKVNMTRANDDPGSANYCLDEKYQMTLEERRTCGGRALFAGLTHVEFDNPTTAPRELSITSPDYQMNVSLLCLATAH